MYLCFFISKAFGSLSYEVYHFPKDKKLRIKLEFTSPNSNQTELHIPHQVWGHDLSNQIKNIHVENGVFIKNANKITHKPNQKIIAWYDILNTQKKLGSSYYTYIIDQGFYFLYKFALICPKLYTNDESIDVDIKFANHNDVFTNFGNIAANKIQKLNLTADNLISKEFAISGNHSTKYVDSG